MIEPRKPCTAVIHSSRVETGTFAAAEVVRGFEIEKRRSGENGENEEYKDVSFAVSFAFFGAPFLRSGSSCHPRRPEGPSEPQASLPASEIKDSKPAEIRNYGHVPGNTIEYPERADGR